MAAEIVTHPGVHRATHDLYYTVHKGIRYAHGKILQKIATCDTGDRDAVAGLARAVEDHLAMCQSHLEHENAQIHTALESRVPGATAIASHQHDDHERSFVELRSLLQALVSADSVAAASAQKALYRRFVLFVAFDFEHMDGEENALQPILQAYFSDDELREIEGRIVSNIPEAEMVLFLRAMLAAASVSERKEMLGHMKDAMPAEAFDGLMGAVVQSPWTFGDWEAFDRV